MDIKQIAFNKALQMLRVANAKYIVIDAEGNQFVEGDLTLSDPKKKMRTPRDPEVSYGTYSNHVRPYLEPLEPGASVVIPFNDMNKRSVVSTITSLCSRLWGRQTYITHANDTHIEVLRLS